MRGSSDLDAQSYRGGRPGANTVAVSGRGPRAAGSRVAHYFFKSKKLEAVRSGRWKLAVAPQSENAGKPKEPEEGPFTPKLYNLDTDIGETTDVSAEHPDVVKRLQQLAAKMDADLGAAGQGPGGRAAKPQPLLRGK